MKKSKIIIGDFFLFLISTVIAYILNKYLDNINFMSNIKIPLLLIGFIIVFSVIIISSIFVMIIDKKNLSYENKIIQIKLEHEKEINEIKAKNQEAVDALKQKNNAKGNKGIQYLGMALSVDLNKKTRYLFFEEALKNKNVYAGIYIGSINFYGIKGKFPKNYPKAYKIFKEISVYDDTGISFWFLGQMYEQGYDDKTKQIGTPNNQLAFEYYTQSEELGFVKAYNSLGRLYNFDEAIIDTSAAMKYYKTGIEHGDVYAMTNLAFEFEKNPLKIKEAEKNFKDASDLGYSFATLRLGHLYMDNKDVFRKCPQEIADLYIKAINDEDLSDDKKACGYFWLCNLLNDDDKIDITKISDKPINNKYEFCFNQAYNLLRNLDISKEHMGKRAAKIWDEIQEQIHNIK